ncbi:MAG: hypothetical protein LCI00_21070 [Chloroflexi bacterium]|nr:hypothetical protein [Chloroflexota bacterium]MCC6892399.1 hypothetical protein [Anaerolineae bacterium]
MNSNSLSNYLNQLETDWQSAYKKAKEQIDANKTPTALVDCVHNALLRSSLNTFAENLTPKIVARLFETNLWTIEDILALISVIPDHYRKAQNYIALLETGKLDRDLTIKVRNATLETANAIDFPAYQSWAMKKLSEFSDAEAQYTALENAVDAAIAYADHPVNLFGGHNGYELCRLIETLPENLLETTERKLLKLKNSEARAWTLTYLAQRLDGDHKYRILAQALQATFAIKGSDVQIANALAQLATHLSGELVPQALDLALSLKEGNWRPRAVVGLMDKIDESQIKRVLESVLTIEDEWWRADGLISVIEHSNDETQLQALHNLLPIEHGETYGKIIEWITSPWTLQENINNAILAAENIPNELHRTQILEQLNQVARNNLEREKIKEINDIEEQLEKFLERIEERLENPPLEDVINARLIIHKVEDKVTQDKLWAKYNELMERGNHIMSPQSITVEQLENIFKIDWEEERAEELSYIVDRIPEDLIPLVVNRSKKFLEWLHRDRVLNRLAPRLSEEVLASAIQEVADYDDTTSLINALKYFARHLDKSQKEKVLNYALDTILAIGESDWHMTDPLLKLRSELDGELEEKATANLPDELKNTTYKEVTNQRLDETMKRFEEDPESKKRLEEQIEATREYYQAKIAQESALAISEPQNSVIELLDDLSNARMKKRESVLWLCITISELVDDKTLPESIIPVIADDIIDIHQNWRWPQ